MPDGPFTCIIDRYLPWLKKCIYWMQNFHKLYRRPRGMYFDATDKGEMVCMPAIPSCQIHLKHSHACKLLSFLVPLVNPIVM